jgi:hypothetical protein
LGLESAFSGTPTALIFCIGKARQMFIEAAQMPEAI